MEEKINRLSLSERGDGKESSRVFVYHKNFNCDIRVPFYFAWLMFKLKSVCLWQRKKCLVLVRWAFAGCTQNYCSLFISCVGQPATKPVFPCICFLYCFVQCCASSDSGGWMSQQVPQIQNNGGKEKKGLKSCQAWCYLFTLLRID